MDVSGDNLNCGRCGNVCASDRFCASGSCQTPFTCQSNFTAAPAGCSAFPLDLNKCGVAGTPVVETLTETPGGGIIDHPLTSAVNEGFRLSGQASSTSRFSGYLNFVFKSELFPDVALVRQDNSIGSDGADLSFEMLSSPYSCARPGLLRLEADANAKYQMRFERFLLSGKHNAGGASLATAVPLDVNAGGRACDQVCGRISPYCATGEDRQQFYRFTLPPRSAAVVELASRSFYWLGFYVHLDAFQSNENVICRLASLDAILDYRFTRGRLVNNTFAPQEVFLKILTNGNTPADYNLAIAVEP
ncbi:hypothetical protein [Archangium sp.]|uniref:hypothetical protein n=1 Tax=Archangium sp. TaxID=1872627 RepID=UPI002D254805|nr:hypothetical protein [Archangium sp.]HYO57035.1 hypothetical protein [Archangium sp.]